MPELKIEFNLFPKFEYTAAVHADETELLHPRPHQNFIPQMFDLNNAALEVALAASSASAEPIEVSEAASAPVKLIPGLAREHAMIAGRKANIGSRSLFVPVRAMATQMFGADANIAKACDNWPRTLRLRAEGGLDGMTANPSVSNNHQYIKPDEYIANLLQPPRRVFVSGCVGPDITPSTRLDAMLNEHARRIATECALPPQPMNVVSKPDDFFDAPEHMDSLFHLSPVKTKARLFKRVRMRPTEGRGRVPKGLKPNHTPETIKKQRKLQRQACQDVKAFAYPIPDALRIHDEILSSDADDLETSFLSEDEDATQRGRLGDLLSIAPFEGHFGYIERTRRQRRALTATQNVETTMGQDYLRQRTSKMEVEFCWSFDAMKAWAITLPCWRYAVQVMMYPPKTRRRSAKKNISNCQKTGEEKWAEIEERFAANEADWEALSSLSPSEKQAELEAEWAENDADWDALSRLRTSELSPDEEENDDSCYRTGAENLERQSLPEGSDPAEN